MDEMDRRNNNKRNKTEDANVMKKNEERCDIEMTPEYEKKYTDNDRETQ
jgi:hypothetical protein